jgi:hypothetical protein
VANYYHNDSYHNSSLRHDESLLHQSNRQCCGFVQRLFGQLFIRYRYFTPDVLDPHQCQVWNQENPDTERKLFEKLDM